MFSLPDDGGQPLDNTRHRALTVVLLVRAPTTSTTGRGCHHGVLRHWSVMSPYLRVGGSLSMIPGTAGARRDLSSTLRSWRGGEGGDIATKIPRDNSC